MWRPVKGLFCKGFDLFFEEMKILNNFSKLNIFGIINLFFRDGHDSSRKLLLLFCIGSLTQTH